MNSGFLRSWFTVAFFNFLLASAAGLILRIAFVFGLAILSFRDLMQGHSHLALLGWIYLGLVILLRKFFLPDSKKLDKTLNIIFLANEATLILMFAGFIFDGYSVITISLLGIHVFLTIWLVRLFYLHYRTGERFENQSDRWLMTSFVFLLISYLGPFALGPINMAGLKGSPIYYIAIQFFLHFQFNGWLIFAVLAIFFRYMRSVNIYFNPKRLNRFYWYLTVSCILTFALGVAWSTPHFIVYLINSVAAVLQGIAAYYLILMILSNRSEVLEQIDVRTRWLFHTSFYCFLAKIFVQTLVVIPLIATISLTIRWYIVGFIHLILLGVISVFMLALGMASGILNVQSKWLKYGLFCFVAGFVLTEILLFGQGTLIWATMGFVTYFHEAVLLATVLLFIGIAMMFVSQFIGKRNVIEKA